MFWRVGSLVMFNTYFQSIFPCGITIELNHADFDGKNSIDVILEI